MNLRCYRYVSAETPGAKTSFDAGLLVSGWRELGKRRSWQAGYPGTPGRRSRIEALLEILILEPYITIAGQISRERRGAMITHDAIVQRMRHRVGSHRIPDGANFETVDAIKIACNQGSYCSDALCFVIDHSAVGEGMGEMKNITYFQIDVGIQYSECTERVSNAGNPKEVHRSDGMGRFAFHPVG